MRKLSESVWGDIRQKSLGKEDRKEAQVGNSGSLKPVDLGGSVFWADRDIEVDNRILFTFDETMEIIRNINGWRLPTRKEASELEGHNMYYDPSYVYLDDDRKISFPKDGVGYTNQQGKPYTLDIGRSFYGWTSSSFRGAQMHVYIIDNDQISFSPDNPTQFNAIVQDKKSKCRIRLVRDK